MILPLDTSYQKHALIGFLIGTWLVFFLVIIAPFDASDLSFRIRLQLMPPYGVITFAVYMALIPVQNWVLRNWKRWNIILEVVFIFFFHTIILGFSFVYYKSGIMNGDYSFVKFVFEVYYPIFFILLFVIVFLRWYLFRPKHLDETETKVMLSGDNKLDVLQLEWSDLIHISSADNYIEVSYFINGALHKKLLRTTIKSVLTQEPRLTRVHRSHLINASHFIDWVDGHTINLTQMIVPVSKSYKQGLIDINNSSLNR